MVQVTVAERFRQLIDELIAGDSPRSFILADLNDLLTAARGDELTSLGAPSIPDSYLANYVAAMVELAAHLRGAMPPAGTADIAPLAKPVFAVPWMSVRPHLLLESPIPFRRRNIFIDSSIGDRV